MPAVEKGDGRCFSIYCPWKDKKAKPTAYDTYLQQARQVSGQGSTNKGDAAAIGQRAHMADARKLAHRVQQGLGILAAVHLLERHGDSRLAGRQHGDANVVPAARELVI